MDTYFEIHIMKLNPSPFKKMASGRKTVELRLFDDKRRKIDICDRVIFTNLEDPEQKIAVKVISLHLYALLRIYSGISRPKNAVMMQRKLLRRQLPE